MPSQRGVSEQDLAALCCLVGFPRAFFRVSGDVGRCLQDRRCAVGCFSPFPEGRCQLGFAERRVLEACVPSSRAGGHRRDLGEGNEGQRCLVSPWSLA